MQTLIRSFSFLLLQFLLLLSMLLLVAYKIENSIKLRRNLCSEHAALHKFIIDGPEQRIEQKPRTKQKLQLTHIHTHVSE